MSRNCAVLCCKKKVKYELTDKIGFCRDHKPIIFKNPRNKNNFKELILKDLSKIIFTKDDYKIIKNK